MNTLKEFAFRECVRNSSLKDDKILPIISGMSSTYIEYCYKVINKKVSLNEVPEQYRTYFICKESLKHYPYCIKYIPKKLVKKATLIYIDVINDVGSFILPHIPYEARTKDVCIAALNKHGCALEYIPYEIVDKEICLAAVRNSGYALKYVPIEIVDKEICLAAVKNTGYILKYIPEEFKDKEIFLAAVKQNGMALSYISYELRDKDICLAAVQQSGLCLRFVPYEFRDEEVCTSAVKSNIHALGYISDKNGRMYFYGQE